MTSKELENQYPLAWAYLQVNKKILENREKGAFKDSQWYRFGRNQNLGMWEQTKLLIPYMITDLSSYYDIGDNFYFINVTTGGYGITIDENKSSYLYLCGLLNSRLLDFYFKRVSTTFHGGYFAANKQYIEQLPIRTINFSDPAEKAQHDKMVALVESMLELHKRLASAKTPQEKEMLSRQIESTDGAIDRLVYELYGLTEKKSRLWRARIECVAPARQDKSAKRDLASTQNTSVKTGATHLWACENAAGERDAGAADRVNGWGD